MFLCPPYTILLLAWTQNYEITVIPLLLLYPHLIYFIFLLTGMCFPISWLTSLLFMFFAQMSFFPTELTITSYLKLQTLSQSPLFHITALLTLAVFINLWYRICIYLMFMYHLSLKCIVYDNKSFVW